MNEYVLDTSVCLAWYLEESFSRSARIWQDRMLSGSVVLLVPSLHFWEFANALRTLVSRREIPKTLALETYELHLQAPLELSEPDRASILATAMEYDSTVYDAVFISLCLSRDARLVTAEKTTRSWVTKLKNRIDFVR